MRIQVCWGDKYFEVFQTRVSNQLKSNWIKLKTSEILNCRDTGLIKDYLSILVNSAVYVLVHNWWMLEYIWGGGGGGGGGSIVLPK